MVNEADHSHEQGEGDAAGNARKANQEGQAGKEGHHELAGGVYIAVPCLMPLIKKTPCVQYFRLLPAYV